MLCLQKTCLVKALGIASKRHSYTINTTRKNKNGSHQDCRHHYYVVNRIYPLRLAKPTSPIRPEPNNQTAAGTGITAAFAKTISPV